MTKREDSLQSRLSTRLQEAPDGPALTFVDFRGDVRWRSFRELHEEASRLGSLLADRGLGPGAVCVVVLRPDEFCATAVLGCLIIGAVPVLVAPPVIRGLHSNLKEVVKYVAETTRARVVLTDESGGAAAAEPGWGNGRAQVVLRSELAEGGDAGGVAPAHPGTNDVAAMQLTSGTTGFPRVCVWEQQRVLAALDGMERAMKLTPEDVCVNWTPLYHDMGLVNNFLLCLVKRVPLAMIETIDFLKKPALWLRTLFNVKATVTWSPNFGFALAAHRIADRELEGVRFDTVRGFWNAAERIHLETMLGFQRRFERFGVRRTMLKTNFGCAENIGGATFSDPDGKFVVEHVDGRVMHEKGVARRVAELHEAMNTVPIVGVGRPYPGMSIKILSRNGRELPDGYVGEIALDTPSRMRGYLRRARETRRAVKGRFLITGDTGYLRGEELFWVGRERERINLHGKKFDPSDFERVLSRIPGLREGCFAAFGIDDEALGTQRLVVVSEVRDSCTTSHADLIQTICEEITKQLGVTTAEVQLLGQGTMTKTSSGKRRHRFYRQVYLDGGLRPVASMRR
jgi:acyl-CoA synthetase (AMP-forming)/AMP-acid ligase II